MRESRSYGSVRGALSDERPYRELIETWFSISSLRQLRQRVTAIRCISFLVRSFATPCTDSACQWGSMQLGA